ncbi:MAG: hypothetical protein J6W79_02420 [Alphaproteobacteria bacterium]|nr:hypothetical protein [Alphaproteobacteria bacterium]
MQNKTKAQIINILKTKFSDTQAQGFIANELAKTFFGPIPDYSCRKSYHILAVNTVTASVFSVCVYNDKIFLLKNHNGKMVCPGGFINIDLNILEQPDVAMLREFNEEVCDDIGKPIIRVPKQKFLPFNTYIDYRKFDQDLTPTVNIAYVLQLTKLEYSKLLNHIKSFADKGYKDKVQAITNNEIYGAEMFDVAEIKAKDFAHPNEFKAIQELLRKL